MPPATEWSLVVLQSVRGRLSSLARRVASLEEAVSVAPTQPASREGDPLGPLFDVLESINGELTGFAARLARLEDTAFQGQLLRRSPRLSSSSSAAATMRAARSRLARKAVPRA